MSKNDNWTLGLIDSAWFGSDYKGKDGRTDETRVADRRQIFLERRIPTPWRHYRYYC